MDLLDSFDKTEIREAIGREIQRIDQVATASGYTSWAIWGALAVMAWKAVDLLGKGASMSALLIYVGLIYFCFSSMIVISIFSIDRKSGGVYFRSPRADLAGRLYAVLTILICLLCALIVWLSLRHALPHFYWPLISPLIFSFFPIIALFNAGHPYRVGGKNNILEVVTLVISVGLSMVGFFCAYVVMGFVGEAGYPSDADIKASFIAFGGTILLYRLIGNMRSSERRGAFQRLEVELTLNKIDVAEARDRYQNLMLGMGLSAAVRPWVNAVTIQLDEAESCISEANQILDEMKRVGDNEGVGGAVFRALFDRFSILIKRAAAALGKADRAADKFKVTCVLMYGVNAFKESPVAQEARSISEVLERVRSAVRNLGASFDVLAASCDQNRGQSALSLGKQ